jgi:hypothetical protein
MHTVTVIGFLVVRRELKIIVVYNFRYGIFLKLLRLHVLECQDQFNWFDNAEQIPPLRLSTGRRSRLVDPLNCRGTRAKLPQIQERNAFRQH